MLSRHISQEAVQGKHHLFDLNKYNFVWQSQEEFIHPKGMAHTHTHTDKPPVGHRHLFMNHCSTYATSRWAGQRLAYPHLNVIEDDPVAVSLMKAK